MQQLSQLWSPSVMVCCSPAANKLSSEENGLSFAEVLRPFGIMRQLNGTVGGAPQCPDRRAEQAAAVRQRHADATPAPT